MATSVDDGSRAASYVAAMTNQLRDRTPDTAAIDRLSTAFNRCFTDFEAEDGLFSDDAFFDLLPPLWRFQLQGGEAFVEQLRSIAEGDVSVEVLRVVPTASGFVVEHVETMDTPEAKLTARRLWLCEVRDGRIADVVGYCNGGWDDDLRARHAAEAPMVRP
jgi:ketosteroid isomerase-like protein